MKMTLKMIAAASLFALAACGGTGDDTLGDAAADAADNRADVIDQQAETMPTEAGEDAMHDQADAIRSDGEMREEAIDDADLNANALTNGQREAIVNGN